MKKHSNLFLVALTFLWVPSAATAADQNARGWWLDQQRLLQTNLREIDATMDIDQYIREVKEFGANVVLFNVGGIVANYPTDLEFHWRNTFLKGDLAGTALKRLHEEGIRLIGRFDFSKINEKYASQHPDWLYVSEKGENVNYNGQVHTCVSGGYQQEYMFKILGEAVDRHPLDGVFFNMIGFTTGDYSGNYHGLCQCQNCKVKFKEFSKLELPKKADGVNPVYRKYREWTRMMIDRQFTRVRDFLKNKRPYLAICSYTQTGVDVIRKESNRPLGQGTYHDTDKAKWTLLTCGERQLGNAAVHFIRIPYRHTAVSPYLTTRRLWQMMINGAWLDFYCIGPLQRQEDRTGLDVAASIYQFHAKNEQWLNQTKGAGQIGLVRRGDQEYEGLLQILSENHLAYELTLIDRDLIRQFPMVIIPDAGDLDMQQCAVLDQYVKHGGKLLLTKQAPEGLRCLGNVILRRIRPREQGAYIRIRPEDRRQLSHPVLDKLDLVFLAGPFGVYETADEAKGLLRLIPQDMFGPPEKCYYRNVSDSPALLHNPYGNGAVAYFPFDIGTHYFDQGHVGHAKLVQGTIDHLLGLERRLKITAPSLVEVTHRVDPDGKFELVGLYNHSGQRDKFVHQPIPIRDIQIDLKPLKQIKTIRLLHSGRGLRIMPSSGENTIVTVPELTHFDAVLFEYQ